MYKYLSFIITLQRYVSRPKTDTAPSMSYHYLNHSQTIKDLSVKF